MVPFDDKSPFVTSGIRIGTSAVTTRGLKEEDCLQLVDWIDQVICNHDKEEIISSVGQQVHDFMEAFPLYQEVLTTA